MSHSLPLFHRIAGQPVIVLGDGDVAEARRRLVERAGGCVVTSIAQGLAEGARLAFIAHDDETDAAPSNPSADAALLRGAGVLVNVADQPALCDFIIPAIVDRAPVLVAVSTGGASAGLAKALRLRLEALLPPALGALAQALGTARGAMRSRFPDAGERRRALDVALGEGGALDVLRGAGDGMAETNRVRVWLLAPESGTPSGVVEIRPRSSDPEDLTLREARLLGSADVIAHEPGVSAAVLARARADARRIAIAPAEPVSMVSGLLIVLRAPG